MMWNLKSVVRFCVLCCVREKGVGMQDLVRQANRTKERGCSLNLIGTAARRQAGLDLAQPWRLPGFFLPDGRVVTVNLLVQLFRFGRQSLPLEGVSDGRLACPPL